MNIEPDIRIKTQRLLLRLIKATDLDALHEIYSNAEAMQYGATPPHRDRRTTRQWLEGRLAAMANGAKHFAIELGGKVIGKAGFVNGGEIGVILHPMAWGHGFAREALCAIIDQAFKQWEILCITADIDPRNKASLRLFETLGFRETGRAAQTTQIAGEWFDSVYLELNCIDLLTGATARERTK